MNDKLTMLIEHQFNNRTVTLFKRGEKGGYIIVDTNDTENNTNKVFLRYNVVIEEFNKTIMEVTNVAQV